MLGASSPSQDLLHSLYSENQRWLVQWLRRSTASVHEAADLAQDTFVRVVQRCPDEIREPRAFLATIARGVLIDHCRRMALERAYLEMLARMPEACAPSPEERAIALQTLEQLDRMLDGLGRKARSAFLLAQLDGLPHREIASRLGVTVSSVEKYIAGAFRHCYRIAYQDGAA